MRNKKLQELVAFHERFSRALNAADGDSEPEAMHLTSYERVKTALLARGPADIAFALGATERNACGWRQRGHVPIYWLIRCERATGHSVRWLAFGQATPRGRWPLIDSAEAEARAEAIAWFGPLFEAFHPSAEPLQA